MKLVHLLINDELNEQLLVERSAQSRTFKFLKDSVSHLGSSTFHQRLNHARCIVSKYQRLRVTVYQLKQLRNACFLPLWLQLGTTIHQIHLIQGVTNPSRRNMQLHQQHWINHINVNHIISRDHSFPRHAEF